MSNEKTQIPTLTVPQGYNLEEFFDTDDSEFNEEPILTEEVKIVFERNDNRKKSGI